MPKILQVKSNFFMIEKYYNDSIKLLKDLIAIKSYSREENEASCFFENRIKKWGYPALRKANNVWLKNDKWIEGKPVILLNSHIDTVKPVEGWRTAPHVPVEEDGKIFGLGSNDAGASLVTLLAVFRILNDNTELPFNLMFCCSAEEEISGVNGMTSLIDEFGSVDLAIVGEPTRMQMAIAEKGLLVIDCEAEGKAGHAARDEGENAIYKAIEDIKVIRDYKFTDKSDVLGEVKMTVTQVEAGRQHNVVPDLCSFVIDVRTNEHYSNKEAYEIIDSLTASKTKARSYRLNSSGLSENHLIVLKGKEIGLEAYGSPTTSDQAVMPFNSIKIGPGDSARSHTANEYIKPEEIRKGIDIYLKLLDNLIL
jgi:acetylornithine deacetylase